MRIDGLLLAFAFLVGGQALGAEEKTVCTITVNSADEKEAFRRHLPKERFGFVELVAERRSDWLRASCEQAIQCDVLVVSGHFNAGDAFYSDRPDSDVSLRVDELERASCSNSCPALFSRLKEVYLFGCESLNPDASKYASSHGDSGRERMRRIFSNVPVIYGFPMAAPAGPAAAARLDRYFEAGASEIGSGRRSSRLLAAFAQKGMIATQGTPGSQPFRRQVCNFFDERLTAAQRLRFIHATMRRDIAEASAFVRRIEGFLASLAETDRQSDAFLLALAEISVDDETRDRFLAVERATREPSDRARMIRLAATLGWLSPEARATEAVGMINDLLASPSIGFAEVDAICALNDAHALNGERARLKVPEARAGSAAIAAALACLGDPAARERVLAALTSGNDGDVRVAQVYLRHRPAFEAAELRSMARGIARMRGTGAQVRALDSFGRLHFADREVVDELTRSFTTTKSPDVQQAIAEVFLRSDAKAIAGPDLAGVLQRHRLVGHGADDLVDVLIRVLATSTSSGS